MEMVAKRALVRFTFVTSLASCLGLVSIAAGQDLPPFQFQLQQPVQPAQAKQRMQIFIGRPGVPAGGGQLSFDFAEDRQIQRLMDAAQKLVEEESYVDAVEVIGRLLSGDQDFFVRTSAEEKTYLTIKAAAAKLVRELPPAGRDAFLTRYSAEAKQALDNALTQGDDAALAAVPQRYLTTPAAAEANYLLGRQALDRGEFGLASMFLGDLRTCSPELRDKYEPEASLLFVASLGAEGMWDEAQMVWKSLQQDKRTGAWWYAGAAHPTLPATAAQPFFAKLLREPESWQSFQSGQVTVVGTNAARTAPGHDINDPFRTEWAAPYFLDRGEAGLPAIVASQRQKLLGQKIYPIIQQHAVAVGDRIVIRNAAQLLCIDAISGRRLWDTGMVQSVEREDLDWEMELLNRDIFGSRWQQDQRMQQMQGFKSDLLASAIARRVWHDAAFGSLSSDGQHVFCLEDLAIYSPQLAVNPNLRVMGRRAGTPGDTVATNRLLAYDIGSGKQAWELGGPDGNNSLPGAGRFFLGPPLPVAGKLFVLADHHGELQLLQIDPQQQGKILWELSLGSSPEGTGLDFFRQLSGLSPSYAQGILVCPTAAGAVVGIDVARQSLLWGYVYDQSPTNRRALIRAAGDNTPLDNGADELATIVGRRVLLSPGGSEKILCLDLMTGELLWDSPRDDGRYLRPGGDMVVMPGDTAVRGYQLISGKLKWELALDNGVRPSGFGYCTQKYAYIPMTTGAIARIDLASGALAGYLSETGEESGSQFYGPLSGNLLWHRGKLLSLSPTEIRSYQTWDEAAQARARAQAEILRDVQGDADSVKD